MSYFHFHLKPSVPFCYGCGASLEVLWCPGKVPFFSEEDSQLVQGASFCGEIRSLHFSSMIQLDLNKHICWIEAGIKK